MIIVRNRLIALLTRLLFIAGLGTVCTLYFLEMSPAWRAFCFLEIQTCAVYLVVLLFELILNIVDMKHGIHGMPAGFNVSFMLMLTGYCFMASLLYFGYIMPVHSYLTLRSILFHSLLLVIPLLNWLLFEPKGSVRYYFSFISILYPMLFTIFSIFRAVIWPNDPLFTPNVMYIYHFLSPTEKCFPWTIWVAIASVIAFFFLLITFNNLLARKWRKTLSSLY